MHAVCTRYGFVRDVTETCCTSERGSGVEERSALHGVGVQGSLLVIGPGGLSIPIVQRGTNLARAPAWYEIPVVRSWHGAGES